MKKLLIIFILFSFIGLLLTPNLNLEAKTLGEIKKEAENLEKKLEQNKTKTAQTKEEKANTEAKVNKIKSNIEQANVVERFLNITDKPFNVIYGAVAVYSNQSYDIDVIKTVVSKKHRDFQKLRILVIHSDELMKFIRELYSKASEV